MWVSSAMALSFVGFISHHFILCGFPLPWLYPTWVCSHTPLYPMWVSSPRPLSYVSFISHCFIPQAFHLAPLYPTTVSSHTASSYRCLLSHRFILQGFALIPLYAMWVSSHTALSCMGFLSQGFILCGFYLWCRGFTLCGFHPPGLYLMHVALSLWVSSPKAFILRGCHPIQQGYISTWSFPFLHNNLDTLIIEELTSTKRLQVKQTERRSIQNVVRATLVTVLRPGTEFKFSIRACLKQVST